MTKILLTSGCSFTAESKKTITWPYWLKSNLKIKVENVAQPSQGNGLISRKLIYQCEKLLESNSPENILVGVMWSGTARHDFYINKKIPTLHTYEHYKNPCSFIENDSGNWVILHPNNSDKYAKVYHDIFYDEIHSQILTLEHILHTQWYFERKNIKYFMMNYTNKTIDKNLIKHTSISYLYNQINFENFIPESCYEWCRDFSNIEFFEKEINIHPNSKQHLLYTQKIILPFLNEKKLI